MNNGYPSQLRPRAGNSGARRASAAVAQQMYGGINPVAVRAFAKGAAKVGARAVPFLGLGLAAYDAYQYRNEIASAIGWLIGSETNSAWQPAVGWQVHDPYGAGYPRSVPYVQPVGIKRAYFHPQEYVIDLSNAPLFPSTAAQPFVIGTHSYLVYGKYTWAGGTFARYKTENVLRILTSAISGNPIRYVAPNLQEYVTTTTTTSTPFVLVPDLPVVPNNAPSVPFTLSPAWNAAQGNQSGYDMPAETPLPITGPVPPDVIGETPAGAEVPTIVRSGNTLAQTSVRVTTSAAYAHTHARPSHGEKEQKVRTRKRFAKVIGHLMLTTEWNDLLNVLYQSLDLKTLRMPNGMNRQIPIEKKMELVAKYWDRLNMEDLLNNWAANYVEDAIAGRVFGTLSRGIHEKGGFIVNPVSTVQNMDRPEAQALLEWVETEKGNS